jgi:2,4-dienoyl-CoA reductase-like NADH-dependent reductase (Old Yellow Enzyme family)
VKSLQDEVVFRCGVVASNRVALAPLTNGQSNSDGTLGSDERAWLLRRARGGFGVIETCAAHVSMDGMGFDGQLGIWGDQHVEGLRTVAQDITQSHALGVVQLYHGGVRSPSRLTGQTPWSASVFAEDKPGFEAPRAATEEDLARVIGQFVDAAVRAEQSGFGGVEIHAAHGYLLGQFLSRTMNTRDDDWGGDGPRRARLTREVVRGIRAKTSKSFVLGVRLSPEDMGFARGLDLDETITTAQMLAEDGIDWLHLSLWNYKRNTRKYPDKHALPMFVEKLPSDVCIVAAGGIATREDADAVLGLGADMVSIGKAAILNPDWARNVMDSTWQPQRPPLTPSQYHDVEVSERFVGYLRKFDGMVTG